MSFPAGGAGNSSSNCTFTAFNILCHVVTDPWPPEVTGDEFCHFPSTRVAGDQGVMVSLHNVVPKLVIKGDVHLSSVEYQSVLLSPFIVM